MAAREWSILSRRQKGGPGIVQRGARGTRHKRSTDLYRSELWRRVAWAGSHGVSVNLETADPPSLCRHSCQRTNPPQDRAAPPQRCHGKSQRPTQVNFLTSSTAHSRPPQHISRNSFRLRRSNSTNPSRQQHGRKRWSIAQSSPPLPHLQKQCKSAA